MADKITWHIERYGDLCIKLLEYQINKNIKCCKGIKDINYIQQSSSTKRGLTIFKNAELSILRDDTILHYNVIKWKYFPRYWPLVWGIHRSPLNSPHKGQWRRVLVFSLIFARINGLVNNRKAGDLRRHRSHYGIIVMTTIMTSLWWPSVKQESNTVFAIKYAHVFLLIVNTSINIFLLTNMYL